VHGIPRKKHLFQSAWYSSFMAGKGVPDIAALFQRWTQKSPVLKATDGYWPGEF
jgi:hypothetical protein